MRRGLHGRNVVGMSALLAAVLALPASSKAGGGGGMGASLVPREAVLQAQAVSIDTDATVGLLPLPHGKLTVVETVGPSARPPTPLGSQPAAAADLDLFAPEPLDDADDIRLAPPADRGPASRQATIRRDAGPDAKTSSGESWQAVTQKDTKSANGDMPPCDDETGSLLGYIGRMHHALMVWFGADLEPPGGAVLLDNSVGFDPTAVATLGQQGMGAVDIDAPDYPFICLCNDEGRCVETCESYDAKGSKCKPGPEKPKGEGSHCTPRKGEWR